MITAKLLIYGLTDEDSSLVDFFFDINQVQAVFMSEEDYISVVISGQIYELEYNLLLLNDIKNILKLKTLGFN